MEDENEDINEDTIEGLNIILKSSSGENLGEVHLTAEEHGSLISFAVIELIKRSLDEWEEKQRKPNEPL